MRTWITNLLMINLIFNIDGWAGRINVLPGSATTGNTMPESQHTVEHIAALHTVAPRFSPTAARLGKNLMNSDDITAAVRLYIDQSWTDLTRSHSNVLLSKIDEKLPDGKAIMYLPPGEDLARVKREINKEIQGKTGHTIELRYLPEEVSRIRQHGLLYLPHPYVVPGGRFNEMYGWDSYFIELGLLESGRLQLAKNMVDNLIYEVNHYGMVLNANRTYYLQRSQPPLLTEMILAYYHKTGDKDWLKSTLPAIDKLYQFWVTPPHLIPELGLSRYYAGGVGKPPEESPDYYEKVRAYFKARDVDDYDKSLYYDARHDTLTELFYIADRTVRESGFDISAKFGPFSAAILDYAPVDLNVLLVQMEKDASAIYTILGEPETADGWKKRAQTRSRLVNQFMWDDKAGYYFDYNFKARRLRPYIYATTFYPLWAGIASPKQARAVVRNLSVLLGKGGLVTSAYQQDVQWDAPFGWAPMQYFAVEGLKKYGYRDLALDLAARFVTTINKGFQQARTIFEKYDVQNVSIHTDNKIKYSYATNEVGFGWTNGVYLVFLNELQSVNTPL
ncbi:Alpha,alpha-trehalase [Legionella spiritensis]|uniref:Alpha,alpha-trehalase n=2 Tax=Legionella spiritensis TaxID=452 RepID=A0A0W0YX52_LEGSP|nr:Alpha,alpha-trehalase [Legionella spiritensis]SNV44746.1 Alpha,alpha-trehalase [Legionella spiritensis]